MTEITKYPSVAQYPNGFASTASNHYKLWSYLSRLASQTPNPAICYDSNSSPLAGKNGTYNRPAPIELKNFGFDIPNGTKIEKVVVYYSQKKVQMSSPVGKTAYPNIGGAKFTLLNCDGVYKTGVSVSSVYTSNKLEFTGITREQLNSPDFGVKIEYPKNANTNTGKVWLGNVYVVVYTTNQTVLLEINNNNNGVNKNSNFELTFNGKYEGSDPFTCDIALNIPSNVTLVSKISGDGSIVQSGVNYYWRVPFSTASTKKITLSFKSSTTGSKTFSIVSGTNSASTTVYIADYRTEVYNSLQEIKNFTTGKMYSYDITLTSNDPNSRTEYFQIRFPLGCTINNIDQLRSLYGATTQTGSILLVSFNITFTSRTVIPINVTYNSSGYQMQYIWINTERRSLVEYEVESQDKGVLAYEYVEIPESIRENMGHNVMYVASCMGKYETSNDNITLKDYGDNLRLGIFNGDINAPRLDLLKWKSFTDTSWTSNTPEGITVHSDGNITLGKYERNILQVRLDKTHTYMMEFIYGSGSGLAIIDSATGGTYDTWLIRDSSGYLQSGETNVLKISFDENTVYYDLNGTVSSKTLNTSSEGVYLAQYHNNNNTNMTIYRITDETADEIILDQTTWCNNIATKGTYNEQKVSFKYNENYPLFFIWSHCYTNENSYSYITYQHSEPVLVEQNYYEEIGEDKVILTPSTNLREQGQYASGVLPPSETTASILCSGWDISELETYLSENGISTTGIVIHGIEINIDYNTNEPVIIESQLHLPGKDSSTRNNIVNKGTGTITLGSEYDLWNYKISDLKDNLQSLGVIVNVTNHGYNTADVEISNLRMKITYIIKENLGNYGFTVDGEHSADYGIFINELKIPFGTDFSRTEYHVDGTDETMVTQANIDSKTLELEISIDDCSIENVIYLIKKLEMLFNNKRDVITNKPNPMKVGFDIMKGWHYDVVRMDQFDGEFEYGAYNTKIKLYVPNGVRVSDTLTSTGKNGSTNGVSNIRPVVYAKCFTNGELNVIETISGLKCIFKDNRIEAGDDIVIDSENRIVTLIKSGTSTEINLINSVDLSTSWFVLNGEYSFESDTGSVYQVSYYEKI